MSLRDLLDEKRVSDKDRSRLFAAHWDMFVKDNAPLPEVQYKWDASRTRRQSDFAYPDAKLLIEIDGGTKQINRGSRGANVGGSHNSDEDRWRSNDAAMLGYRFCRFTPEMITRDPIRCINAVLSAAGLPIVEPEG